MSIGNKIEYGEVAFMADLILDKAFELDTKPHLPHYDNDETLKADMSVMAGIVSRLQMQVDFISGGMRSLRERHKGLEHPLERRYSVYENMLAQVEMNRHSALWMHAVRYHTLLAEQYQANGPKPTPDHLRSV